MAEQQMSILNDEPNNGRNVVPLTESAAMLAIRRT